VDVVFGRVEGAYGRDVGGRGWCDARVQMWGLLELWELVQCLGVGGDGFDFLSVVLVLEEVRVQERYFRTPSVSSIEQREQLSLLANSAPKQMCWRIHPAELFPAELA
jgi:hypothetical protein